jgi:DNA-binding GntR family transcriptional regulator
MFVLRLLLEVPASYRAAQQAGPADLREMRRALDAMQRLVEMESSSPEKHLEPDARFHRAIILAAGNKRIAAIVDNLFALQMARGVSTWGINRSRSDIYDDHARIYERLKSGDPNGTAEAMRKHLSQSALAILVQESGEGSDEKSFDLFFRDVLDLARAKEPISKPGTRTKGLGRE